jgi:hypothetical protein
MRTLWNVFPSSRTLLILVIYESPLFVRQVSKRVLRHSLWNDTLFLAKMNVMDYSLVIGIDEENSDLILGIIGIQVSLERSDNRFYSHFHMG